MFLNPGQYNWSYTVSAPSFFYANGSDTFTITVTAFDQTVDVIHSSASVPVSFVYESVPPVSTISTPTPGAFYNTTTNLLSQMAGTAMDPYTGLGTGISTVWLQIQYAGPDGTFNTGDDLYWNQGSLSWSATPSFSTATLTGGGSGWTYSGLPPSYYHSTAGAQYLIMSQAFDNGRSASAPNAISPASAMREVTPSLIGSPNYYYFIVDSTAPVAIITQPSGSPTNIIPSVSGTATDTSPGLVTSVQIAYRDTSTNQWWDPVAQSFVPGYGGLGGTDAPPAAALISTPVIGGVWSFTGASTPTFTSGNAYQIFAMAVDSATNHAVFPGDSYFTVPPSSSSYIQFTFQIPPPATTITSPDNSNPNWQPNAVVLAGTSQNATTAQVQIVDCGPNLVCGTGNDDLYWTGSAWASTSGWVNNGFTGVTSFNGITGAWTMTLTPSTNWNGNRNYTIESMGVNSLYSETPKLPALTFVVDNAQPAVTLVTPDTSTYRNNLPVLSGNATDIAPGTVSSVLFHAIRDDNKYWNWQASTFTVPTLGATDLAYTSVVGSLWSYTTDYFLSSSTGAWENGRSYTIHEVAVDKAGNQTDQAQLQFTFDIFSPTATIVVPAHNLTAIRSMPTISGTAANNLSNANVMLAIYSIADVSWYDGSGFNVNQSTPNFFAVSTVTAGGTAWSYTVPLNTFRNNHQYILISQAIDSAGNAQSNFATNVSSFTISIDTGAPANALVPPPTNGASYQPGAIGTSASSPDSRFTGTDGDPGILASGVNKVQVQLSYVLGPDTYYWDGNAQVFSSYTVTVSSWFGTFLNSPTTWIYQHDINWPTDASHLITLKSQTVDNAALSDGTGGGNVSATSVVSFNVDFVLPGGTITWPSANATLLQPHDPNDRARLGRPGRRGLDPGGNLDGHRRLEVLLDEFVVDRQPNVDHHHHGQSLVLHDSVRGASLRQSLLSAPANHR